MGGVAGTPAANLDDRAVPDADVRGEAVGTGAVDDRSSGDFQIEHDCPPDAPTSRYRGHCNTVTERFGATSKGLSVTQTTPDVRREDAIGTPPPPRPTLVPVERYHSPPTFARLENERMWPKVWQLACTVDHVAEPGDYFEYRCGPPYSVLIVRDDDGVLRAFQNVCRHRGNSLCSGSGSELRELRCGYHGWTWDLSGVLRRVRTARVSVRCG